MELKLTSHLTRSHNISSITLRITLWNSRSSHRPILSYFKILLINKSIRVWSSKTKTIKITTMRTSSKVFHNTNLSFTIRSNQTILLNKPMCLKLNFKSYTTFTNICFTSNPKNRIIKLHTTHSLPSPIYSSNIYNTFFTLTLSQEIKRKSIIVHTKSIGQSRINFRRFTKHKMSDSLFIRITSIVIITTLYFS